jgi:hypothetical protein
MRYLAKDEKRDAFLEAMVYSKTIPEAAEEAGVSMKLVEGWMESSVLFQREVRRLLRKRSIKRDQALELFLKKFAATGRFWESARECGVSGHAIKKWAEKHPAFKLALEEAQELFADSLERAAHVRAVDGTDGGSRRRMYSDKLLEMMLKKVRPEYRDSKVDVKVGAGAGVLVVGGMAKSIEDWKSAERKMLGVDGGKVVDVEASVEETEDDAKTGG